MYIYVLIGLTFNILFMLYRILIDSQWWTREKILLRFDISTVSSQSWLYNVNFKCIFSIKIFYYKCWHYFRMQKEDVKWEKNNQKRNQKQLWKVLKPLLDIVNILCKFYYETFSLDLILCKFVITLAVMLSTLGYFSSDHLQIILLLNF